VTIVVVLAGSSNHRIDQKSAQNRRFFVISRGSDDWECLRIITA
jgi:hypothetical protein